jgi:hypothetical protein
LKGGEGRFAIRGSILLDTPLMAILEMPVRRNDTALFPYFGF